MSISRVSSPARRFKRSSRARVSALSQCPTFRHRPLSSSAQQKASGRKGVQNASQQSPSSPPATQRWHRQPPPRGRGHLSSMTLPQRNGRSARQRWRSCGQARRERPSSSAMTRTARRSDLNALRVSISAATSTVPPSLPRPPPPPPLPLLPPPQPVASCRRGGSLCSVTRPRGLTGCMKGRGAPKHAPSSRHGSMSVPGSYSLPKRRRRR